MRPAGAASGAVAAQRAAIVPAAAFFRVFFAIFAENWAADEIQRHNHVLYRHGLPQECGRLPQSCGALGRASIQTAVLYGAGALVARHYGAQRRPHLLYAHVAGARGGAGLRRGQGLRLGRWPRTEPLRGAAAEPRGDRLRCGLRTEGAGAYAGRLGGSGRCADPLLGRDQGLRLDRGRLQQHLGGEGYAQRRPQVQRLHRRRGHSPYPVGGILVVRQLRRRDPRRGGLARVRGAFAGGVACGDVGDVHLHIRRAARHQGAPYVGAYGGYRRGHCLPPLPVGVCLPAAVDDLLQRHLRQFRRPAPLPPVDADLVGNTPSRGRAVVRLPERGALRFWSATTAAAS